jgi:hypothetical protein
MIFAVENRCDSAVVAWKRRAALVALRSLRRSQETSSTNGVTVGNRIFTTFDVAFSHHQSRSDDHVPNGKNHGFPHLFVRLRR